MSLNRAAALAGTDYRPVSLPVSMVCSGPVGSVCRATSGSHYADRNLRPGVPAAPRIWRVGPVLRLIMSAFHTLRSSASLIGGKRRVRAYKESDWQEPCILWTGLVGDPSNKKSPALDRATTALRGMEGDHATDHDESVPSLAG
jgi:hypothetical protein